LFENLREDTRRLKEIKTKGFPWYVIESLLFENGYQAVVLHRLAHWFKRRRIPVLGPLIARFNQFLTGVEIGPGAEIGLGLRISHGVGIVIGGYTRIGRNALLLHQVTIGSPHPGRVEKMPVIGDNVFIGAGAKVIGDIAIGDDVFIGVNAIVAQDIPSGSRVLCTSGIEISPRKDVKATLTPASDEYEDPSPPPSGAAPAR
jgi:serine O-acetyltransferase